MAHVIYVTTRLLLFTYRFKTHYPERRAAAERHNPRGTFALAVWHENLLATILSQKGSPYSPLASHSRDGEYVAYLMKKIGFSPVRGSSSKGGSEARAQIVERLRLGFHAAITVDGPRGPRREVKFGIIDIARKAGVAILPIAVVADRCWTLRSWDRFRVPKPFARIAVCYGEPLLVGDDLSREAQEGLRVALGETLNKLDDAAFELLAAPGGLPALVL